MTGGNGGAVTHRLTVSGRVQGVGFRPFIYRLAQREGVSGWVRNLAGQVDILAQGDPPALHRFAAALIREAPPAARPLLTAAAEVTSRPLCGFTILPSEAGSPRQVHVPPDLFTCDDCLREMSDPNDRRFGYPFINCTQCGPRYTVITALPYDRANTTLAGFPLCPECSAAYGDPADRRFHAEPVACPVCGPRLRYAGSADPLDAAIAALHNGGVIAIKGVGGYHLVCDAGNPTAVAALRARKHRPHKPLALVLPQDDGLATLRALTCPTADEIALLTSPMRPIVLVRKRQADAVLAPGVNELGVMLPYSPLHHLLLRRFGGALVATSGNVSGEPVLTDDPDAEARLGGIADGFLHHNRPIARPADDPVYRVIAGRPRPIRLGRGNAPLEIELPVALPHPILALGGQMKATIALGWGRRAVVSPHLGDLESPRALGLLRQVATDLQALYGVQAEALCCDNHPNYASTRRARGWGLPVRPVFHHAAHASALAAEYPGTGDWIVFTWDGAGLGSDGSVWGGEALVGTPGHWQRRASFRSFPLLGGDKAARQPWRSALALAWESGSAWSPGAQNTDLLHQAWQRGVNCPPTSSVGRLFDAAASMLGLADTISFEGQAAMYLEAVAAAAAQPVPLPLTRDATGLWRTDWAPLLPVLRDRRLAAAERAGCFHTSLAAALVAQAETLRAETGITRIGLTGGVFQNRLLTEAVFALAGQAGFAVFLPDALPCNDAGLSFGQLIEAAACP